MVKSLPRVLYHGVKILVNSVKKSIQEEIEMSRQLARIRYQEKEAELERERKQPGMSLEEAQRILDVPNLGSSITVLMENCITFWNLRPTNTGQKVQTSTLNQQELQVPSVQSGQGEESDW